MDLYYEARWYFEEEDRVTWYEKVVQDLLVAPRLPRFGVLQAICSSVGGPTSVSDACDNTLFLRTSPEYAVSQGYPADYASPISLFSDIGNMELNDPCRLCIEAGYNTTITTLTPIITGVFQVLAAELGRLLQSGTVTAPADLTQLQTLFGQVLQIVGNAENPSMVSRASVEEFYTYYVTRSLYAQLGAPSYVANYASFMENFGTACVGVTQDPASCPLTVTPEEATAALLNHADNTFSSVTTAGNPFPFWSEGDGTGSLFAGTSPVGGSGVPMAGQLLSTAAYLDIANFSPGATVGGDWNPLYSNGEFLDPITPGANWAALVDTDPVYRWFLAGVTPKSARK